jgi:flagellar biosynthesis protein FlhF
MRVKSYLVNSMPDAMQLIRSELGSDAIILNTKEVRSGGFLGLFGKKKIEVIAAAETNASMPNSGKRPPKEHVQQAPFRPAPAEEPLTKADSLSQELRQMKEMLQQLSLDKRSERMPPALLSLERKLLEQEVEPGVAHALVDGVLEDMSNPELHGYRTDEERIFAHMRQRIKQILVRTGAEGSRGIADETRIVQFVGPTGVGKTTTIAKLAADQVLKHKRTVGFITSDTYRIAAVEQLRTYAAILDVPLEVVVTPAELSEAYRRMQDRDLIFVDTAGRNYRNELYVSELNALLQNREQSETYLVLSMTMKYRDMRAITEHFSKFKLDKLLFTKLDETDTYGALLNMTHHFPYPLSYITNGQNVPDDITLADADRIADLLLEVRQA